MTARIAANYLNSDARTNAQMKTALEDLNKLTKEALGGEVESELTLNADSVTPTGAVHNIDTQADAASDNLATLGQANHPDGRLVLIRCNNAARAVVVKHAAGGTGQILLAEGADLTLNDTTMWLLLIRTGTTWTEVLRGYGNTTRRPPRPVAADAEKLLEATANGYVLAAPRRRRNAVINGGCQVAQRATASLSAAYKYGAVDRFACRADGSPTAGSITQAETALLGKSGYAAQLSGVSTGSGGAVLWRYRIEARDARPFVNAAAVISCHVFHDAGSARNFTITVNRANAEDDFAAITLIGASANISAANATDVPLALAVSSMGACGNGIEIIVRCDSGAVTNKNFYLTELQLEAGSLATEFEHMALAEALAQCQRYYLKSYSYGDPPGTASASWAFRLPGLIGASGGVLRTHVPFAANMRVAPAVTLYGDNGAAGVLTVNGANRSASAAVVRTTGFGTINNDSATAWNDGEGILGNYTADAEL